MRVLVCALLASLLMDVSEGAADISTLKRLYNDTLFDYDTRIRPINDQTAAVYVNTKFVPQSLLEFDTSEQKFSMLGYFEIHWTDQVMRWNPALYDGTDSLKLPTDQIWTPGIIILKVTLIVSRGKGLLLKAQLTVSR